MGFAFVTMLAVALALSIVGRHAGWPDNDEFTSQAFETQIYSAHFRQLDFFPVWSTSDAFGLGSPLPLYYHKAFFVVSGTAYLILGNIKATLVLSLGLFMVVGVYGMRAALSVITKRRLLITVGALGLIFTNYAFTDWLVRGDFAEILGHDADPVAALVVPQVGHDPLGVVLDHPHHAGAGVCP